MQVIHRDSFDNGVLLFLKQYEHKEGTFLQIEFVHKTWLGWKWVMGGGYGLSNRLGLDEALNYMSMPKFKGIEGPYPIVFGQITNSTITNVIVTISGEDAGKYSAKLIEYGAGQRLWYVVLPSSASAPYEIEAISGDGVKVASRSFEDSRDFASVLMSN
ncbi:hypothetical protein [Cohnella sp.]|uniref:hypothetical protein n=1 Tax=Cohnella sp. TaxID=1883426 RepID=UPI0035669B45